MCLRKGLQEELVEGTKAKGFPVESPLMFRSLIIPNNMRTWKRATFILITAAKEEGNIMEAETTKVITEVKSTITTRVETIMEETINTGDTPYISITF